MTSDYYPKFKDHSNNENNIYDPHRFRWHNPKLQAHLKWKIPHISEEPKYENQAMATLNFKTKIDSLFDTAPELETCDSQYSSYKK